MPDYKRMRGHIERAQIELENAVKSLLPMSRMTPLQAYLLGFLRGTQTLTKDAIAALNDNEKIQPPGSSGSGGGNADDGGPGGSDSSDAG